MATGVLGGARIYTDVFFEYPPYALVWFLGPAAIAGGLAQFRLLFGLLIWTLDAAVKGALIWEGLRARDRTPRVLPFVLYVLATAAVGHILLQRFDVIPAALSLAALVAVSRGWAGAAGVLIAVAAGTKVFPGLYVPILAVFAWRRGREQVLRFAAGVALGLLPLIAASASVPWWNFLEVHAQRGLQAESLWASVAWMLHFIGVPAQWALGNGWIEVTGPVAGWLAAPAHVVWVGATVASVALASWAAWRGPWADAPTSGEPGAAWLPAFAVLLLLPVSTFVALSPVLSPQFHLWLIPWCAIVLATRERSDPFAGAADVTRAIWCIFLTTFLVPVFFPSPTYDTGLDLGRTAVLVARNVLLLYATWCLWRAVVSYLRPKTCVQK